MVRRLLPMVPPELAVIDRECEVVRRMIVVGGGILVVVSGEMVVMCRMMGFVWPKLAVVS